MLYWLFHHVKSINYIGSADLGKECVCACGFVEMWMLQEGTKALGNFECYFDWLNNLTRKKKTTKQKSYV